ncbi:MAG: membrane protein insertion efficiency factor YidD [Chitinophagaceae bacterium]|nr:membrane protein insertion efficiency factor YidD [Chitinophagaceae bacterium]
MHFPNFIKIIRKTIIFFISVYQYCISPLFLPSCKFIPSCSQYTKESIVKYGIWKGMKISIQRISKCHMFTKKNGYDPVP